jgi:predicted nucleotidyltransferase
MDPSAIPLILKELNLNENDVANIYHHGSWVYGSNTRESDRDLIFVTRSSVQRPIKFHEDFDYFHEFELHKLWNQYDICIYSVKNFEILLKKNYLCVLQCVFLPAEFKIKEEIDFRTIYLEKYYNPLRIKQVAAYEMSRDLNLYYSRNDRQHLINHPTCSSKQLQTSQLRENYIFKNLFHGIRFLDFAEQLLQTKSISDFTRATYVLKEMKRIRRNFSRSSDLYP